MKLVRVVDNVVVQWTITMAEVRASMRLRQLIDQRAAKGQEVQVDIGASGSPPSPPLTTKKQDGGGGTQMEML
ncbi:hypothetical protein SB690_20640, partial [Bacillus sp. SIMBA_006]|uniref:hypothetical protein n=1 Tax=Bacillus sp. SIMBA_006 TaxID=3085755 RepID=UPI0039791542